MSVGMALSRWDYYALDRVVARVEKVEVIVKTTALTVGCLGVIFSAACRIPAFKAMDRDTRAFSAHCVTGLLHALVITPLAITAAREFWNLDGTSTDAPHCTAFGLLVADNDMPVSGLYANGVACGWFVADLILMAWSPSTMMKVFGGSIPYKIMFMHHSMSLVVWNMSLAWEWGSSFVLYFILTEISNIGQTLFLLSSRSKLFGGELILGLAWAATFFVLRIAVLPFFLVCWLTLVLDSCSMPLWGRCLTLSTSAIPPFLNMYWFWKISNKMSRMLSSEPGRRDSKSLLAHDGKTDRAENGKPNGKNSKAAKAGNGALDSGSWLQRLMIRVLTAVLGKERSFRLARWFFARPQNSSPAQPEEGNGVKPPTGAQPSAGGDSEWTLEGVTALVRENVQKFCGPSCKDDTPLLEAGMESSSAVAIRDRILAVHPDVKLPNTLIFDYPNIAAIGKFIYEQIEGATDQIPVQVQLSASAADEPLAILGMACRFPGGATNPELYWDALIAKTNAMGEIPFSRWDVNEYFSEEFGAVGKMYVRKGAFINDGDLFDAAFFNISGRETKEMDPQQRLLLEVSFDAFNRAGYTKESLLGSDAGVFVGQSTNDWIQHTAKQDPNALKVTPFTGTGMSASVSAGRISYILGLKGPAYTVDTACSSALVAVDSAATQLRRGRCSVAVASGVNMILSAGTYIGFCQARMLSPDGSCKTFDEAANGYARGEGCGSVVLQLASAATGRNILGYVKGTALNQDGRSSSLTAPNGPSQQAVINAALAEAGVRAADVDYVECHGTGTPLGDPIEISGLKGVLGNRGAGKKCILGAVKTNMGHMEAAAGVSGLIKAVLSLQRRQVPANLHFRKINPAIDIDGLSFTVPVNAMALPSREESSTVTAGLSSFGFSGTNAHVVLGDAPQGAEKVTAQPEPVAYARMPFPWRELGPRLCRRKIEVEGKPGFEVEIKDDLYKVVAEHVLFGSIVVPGVVYTEMALEAVQTLFGVDAYVKDIAMVFPLVVPWQKEGRDPGSYVCLRFVTLPGERFELQSVASADAQPVTHAEGEIGFLTEAPAPPKEGLEELKERCVRPVPPSDVYKAIDYVGLYLGPNFQVAKEVFISGTVGKDDDDVLCRLEAPEGMPNQGYIMHPALFDGTIHTLGTHSLGKDVRDLKIYGGAGSAVVHSHVDFSKNKTFWVHLKITDTTENDQTFTSTVFDESGNTLLVMGNVIFRKVVMDQIRMAMKTQRPADSLRTYEVEWTAAQPEPDFVREEETWLVLGYDEGLRRAAEAAFGSAHTYAHPTDAQAQLASGTFGKVLSLCGLESTVSALDVLDSSCDLIRVVSAVAEGPSLWFVTSGAQKDPAKVPMHAGVWGLARTARNEYLGLKIGCIDVDASLSSTEALDQIRNATVKDGDAFEAEIVLRKTEAEGEEKKEGCQQFVSRLLESDMPEAEEKLACVAEATYVITGGVGALGLLAAEWLVDAGARTIVLLSRSGVPPDDAKEAFDRLAATPGVKVVTLKCDVADAKAVAAVFAQVKQTLPPVKGVIHAAGFLNDMMIKDLTREKLVPVLGPKVQGTLNLHEASEGLALDFFVCYSSIAALLGTPAQGNYSAANAFMDSFATYRRGQGLAATSVQWGPWGEIGMAAR
jgi:acyl transferase domain-containing protein